MKQHVKWHIEIIPHELKFIDIYPITCLFLTSITEMPKESYTIPYTTLIMTRLICITDIAFGPLRPIDIATPKQTTTQ